MKKPQGVSDETWNELLKSSILNRLPSDTQFVVEVEKEFQVIVYDDEDSIVSSQHFNEEPNEEVLNELLSEGVKLECHEVEGDHYSKLLFTMDK
jgi:hypothetical protein